MLNGIFTNPAFGMEALTDSILQVPFIPMQVGSLGLFAAEGIPTTTIDIESDGVNVTLIPNSQRGGPATNYRKAKRTMRSLNVPHFVLDDTIKPEAVQNVRQFGTNNLLQGAQYVVNQHLTGMALSHDLTLEYGRLGAIKGVIYDWDGQTVIYNLFTEFGIAQTTFDFALGDMNANIKATCTQVSRAIEVALGQARIYSHVHCLCGNDFFDAFVAHPDVADAYRLWQDTSGNATWGPASKGQQGDWLRADNRRGFPYCGIYFENYIGSAPGAAGSVVYMPPGEAHFFPMGVPDLFKTVFAPADMWEAVNTFGLPRYASGEPLRHGRGIELLTESNPLSYCTRPGTLVLGTTSTYPPQIQGRTFYG